MIYVQQRFSSSFPGVGVKKVDLFTAKLNLM